MAAQENLIFVYWMDKRVNKNISNAQMVQMKISALGSHKRFKVKGFVIDISVIIENLKQFSRPKLKCEYFFIANIHDLSEKSAFVFSMITIMSMMNP